MTRDQAMPHVSYVVDDAGHAGPLNSDQFLRIYSHSRLVGWQCGFGPMFVAVHNHLNVNRQSHWPDFDARLSEDEAVKLAMDYLEEIGWFADGPVEPNYCL